MASTSSRRLFLGLRLGGIVAALIFAGPLFAASPPVRGQDPDLAQIAHRLQQWRSSFVNLRAVWEWWTPSLLKNPRAARPSPDEKFDRVEWVWADFGAVRRKTWFCENGEMRGPMIDGGDGRTLRSFKASYVDKPGQAQFLKSLSIFRMASPEPWSVLVVEPLADLYDAQYAVWLGDRLAQGQGELEKHEDIEGVPCARVRIDDRHFFNTLWLDPRHDLLVRRIRPHPQKPVGGFVFDVEEFQRVGAIWFPKRGTLGRDNDKPSEMRRWLVTDVALNLALDAKFFAPPAPEVGTRVEDMAKGSAYVFGEKRRGQTREGEIAEGAKKNLSEADSRATADAPLSRTLWWSGLLLVVSVSLLVTGVGVLWWRRS